MTLADIFFPSVCHLCGALGPILCTKCCSHFRSIEHDWCVRCGLNVVPGRTCTRCVRHAVGPPVCSLWHLEGNMKKAIWAMKYERDTLLIPELFLNMSLSGLAKISFVCGLVRDAVLVPIPLHPHQERRRGYNQSLLIARALSVLLDIPVDTSLLRRKRETAPQARTLTHTQRASNISGAFTLGESRAAPYRGAAILVDDVITSGSTIKEAARVLERYHIPTPLALCLAREKHFENQP